MNTIDLVGRLIAFEGIDPSGKSTQALRLAQRLSHDGVDVVSTGEPGGTVIGNAVRRILLACEHHTLLPFSELLLFLVSRAQNTQEVILPAIRQGRTVVASRYWMSSAAYQGYGRGLDLGLIRQLNAMATQGTQPDVTFLIDLPAEEAIRRKSIDLDRIETEAVEFHCRVRDGFLAMAEENASVVVIDGMSSSDDIAERVIYELRRRFCRSGHR